MVTRAESVAARDKAEKERRAQAEAKRRAEAPAKAKADAKAKRVKASELEAEAVKADADAKKNPTSRAASVRARQAREARTEAAKLRKEADEIDFLLAPRSTPTPPVGQELVRAPVRPSRPVVPAGRELVRSPEALDGRPLVRPPSSVTPPAPEATPPSPGSPAAPAATARPPSTLSPDELRQRIAAEYPAFAYLLDEPDLGDLLRRAIDEGMTPQQFAGHLYGTTWWKTHADSVRKWDAEIGTDPASASRRLMGMLGVVETKAKEIGLVLDPAQVNTLADNAIRFAWSDQEMKKNLAANLRAKGSLGPGGPAGQADALSQLARQYLVTLPRSDLEEWAIRIYEGTATEEGFRSYLIPIAKSRFMNADGLGNKDVLAGLDAGYTTSQMFAGVRSEVARILELDATNIDLLDPKYSDLVDHVDDKGNRRGMTLGEASRWARQRPEFGQTKVYRETTAEYSLGLSRFMGATA